MIIKIFEILSVAIGALWAIAFIIAGLRRLISGPDKELPVDAAFIAHYEYQSATEGWFHRFLVAFDIMWNVIFRGQEDETLSGHSYRAALEGKLWGRIMTYWLSLFQVQHGVKAVIGDLQRAKSRVIVNSKVLGLK